MKYFTYKTTNKINNRYYYGVHATKNVNDGYIGSGKLLIQAIEKYGYENFEREIINFHSSYEEALKEEAQLITQVEVDDRMCYNITLGGGMPPLLNKKLGNHHNWGKKLEWARQRMLSDANPSKGKFGANSATYKTVVVYDSKANTNYRVTSDDPRLLSGELKHINKNKITVRDKANNVFHVTKDDPRWNTGEIVHVTKGLNKMKVKCICGYESNKSWVTKHKKKCKVSQYSD